MAKRLRILLSAYFCSPYKGSESGLGWNVASRLARHHDVTVLCGDLSAEQPTRKDLERYSETCGLPDGLTVLHVSPDLTVRLWNRFHEFPGMWFTYYTAYRNWQKLAYKEALRIHSDKPFDVVHHLNIIGYREPGYLWKLDAPFFWGPLAGASVIPFAFLRDFSPMQKLRWGSRNLVNILQANGSRRCRMAAGRAHTIWTVSGEDFDMITCRWGFPAESMLEVGGGGFDAKRKPKTLETGEILQICWSGIFQGIKALPLLLKALAELPNGRVKLHVLGNGPEERCWKHLMNSLDLAEIVQWHGMLPREDALAVMNQCHVLAHTSIKEATATVLLEALGLGLPVICHDACGMAIAVNERCGIRVKLHDPATSVAGFRNALQLMLNDPHLLEELSRGALNRAQELSWESNIARMADAYLRAVEAPITPP
jgi:glycosyltransferase involved in cell wall biosynthesis